MTPRILGEFDNFLGDLPGTARQGKCDSLAVQVRKSYISHGYKLRFPNHEKERK